MKKLTKLAAFGILMGGLMSNTAFAGLLISDVAAPAPCTETEQSFTGLLISDFAGLLISDVVGTDTNTCPDTGSNLTGLLISD